MFINCSNHPWEKWNIKQIEAAQKWGEIVDYPFPQIPASADSLYVEGLADAVAKDIIAKKPDAVMCQGEHTFTYALVSRLQKAGILVVSASSERNVRERIKEDGSVEKSIIFKFVQFRQYEQ